MLMAELNPIGIILATSGSRGDRVLFRYPYETVKTKAITSRTNAHNPYAVKIAEDYSVKCDINTSNIENGILVRFNNQTLANLLAIKLDLCDRRFDVKIKDVRFIGYPLQLHPQTSKIPHTILSFNVVVVLRANVEPSVVSYYQDLAKQLTVAIRHEERRGNYLSLETKAMQSVHDEVQAINEEESPFRMILQQSQLARELRMVYDSLCQSGVVHLYVNRWVEVNFCLPHKVHLNSLNHKGLNVKPEAIQKCLAALRPFHGMLLLVNEQSLLESMPVDCTPTLVRLIQVVSPLKNLQTVALDADLSLSQVFQLVSHLVYWAKAMVIFPLCEHNIYVLSPQANICINSQLPEAFERHFPGTTLLSVLSEYSLPIKMSEYRDVLEHPRQQAQKVQMVVWMLQHRLLMQLHTYVFLSPPAQKRRKKISEALLSCTPLSQSILGRSMPDFTIEENSYMERTQSSSDIASVNSDESIGLGPPHSTSSQLSKSPSLDLLSVGGGGTEEAHVTKQIQDMLLKHLTPEELENVSKLPASRNLDDLKLFARLCCYFNGKHHLEEIMYFENLNRSQVIAILDKFRDVLETCMHEDPATAFQVR